MEKQYMGVFYSANSSREYCEIGKSIEEVLSKLSARTDHDEVIEFLRAEEVTFYEVKQIEVKVHYEVIPNE